MNSGGSAFRVVDFDSCIGDFNVIFSDGYSGITYNWQNYFNIGAWRIYVRGANDAGVGGLNYPVVYLGHICSMSMI